MRLTQLLRKNHEYQSPGFCGPASVRILLKAASEVTQYTDPIPNQHQIAQEVFSGPIITTGPKEWHGWPAYCLPWDIAKYFGEGARYSQSASLNEIRESLNQKCPVLVLWTEDLPDRHSWIEGGHYSIISGLNDNRNSLIMVDPSNAERLYDPKGGVFTSRPTEKSVKWTRQHAYELSVPYFVRHWYDVIEETNDVIPGAMISVDLNIIKPRVAITK
jgi:hypothetical protein